MKPLVLCSLALCMLVPAAAVAQSAPVTEGSSFVAPPTSLAPMTAAGESGEMPMAVSPAQMEVRVGGIEDELRTLRGKNEELEFQIRRLTESMEKMQRDFELRFGDIEGTKSAAAPAAGETGGAMAATGEAAPASTAVNPPAAIEGAPTQTTAGDGVLRMPDASQNTPKDLYNQALRLLNQTKYEEAARLLDQFTKQYPKDPLVGNAYYWAGETHYIRRDYVTAADSFRAGFEALPTGPKAPDNLLKLAMSLDALNRDKEACVVLQQVVGKFKKDAIGVAEKAAREQKRIGCS